MTTLTVVMDDKVIIKDGAALHFTDATAAANFDAVVAAQGHTTKWAIQWDGTTGEIEDADPSNDHITPTQAQIDAYIAAWDAENERVRQQMKTDFLAQDAAAAARAMRNELLAETDWVITYETEKAAVDGLGLQVPTVWTDYRQALRDLPSDAANWNPTYTWNDAEWSGSLTGVNWPTKP